MQITKRIVKYGKEARTVNSILRSVTGLWPNYERKQFPGEDVCMIYGTHDIEVSVMYYYIIEEGNSTGL